MTESAHSSRTPIHVRNDQDAERNFVFHPENDDLFVRTGREVIAHCQLGISIELWLKEMSALLAHVSAWIQQHQAQRIRLCLAAPRGIRTQLFFVPAGPQFDFELADALAELNIALLQKFNIGMVELCQIPADEIDRFLNPEKAKLVYGHLPEPHQPVEA